MGEKYIRQGVKRSEFLNLPTVKRALLWERAPGEGRVLCGLCEQRCEIDPGGRGFCGTRVNIDGELYTIVYGDILAVESRPSEIKPLFSFPPRENAFDILPAVLQFEMPVVPKPYHFSRASKAT